MEWVPSGSGAQKDVQMNDGTTTTIDPAMAVAQWADELHAMSAIGLLYTQNSYDRERYARLQQIAEAMFGFLGAGEPGHIHAGLSAELGYVTPKVGVAAAVFDERRRILLVRRRDNALWAMPGGWADVGESAAEMTAREAREETGLVVAVDRLLGLYDSFKRGFRHPQQIYHVVFLCSAIDGTPAQTEETLGVEWFAAADLPDLSPGHLDPIRDAFRALADPALPAVFD
jgi:ADP-ribose pyrophosphatase YjhB (NUDIX family)